eukprot:gene8318-11253_t
MGSKISSIVFQPPEVTYMQAKKHIIWLHTKGREENNTTSRSIPAFFIDRKSEVTFIFSHGNAEDIGMIYDWFFEFSREIHVNVLAYDYEGYGKTNGFPSEQNCYDDIDAAYNYLTTEKNISSDKIVLYGRSLGSGPSCYLAERLSKENIRLGGLILQSPFLSVFRVAFDFRFTLPCDMFPNIDRIKNVKCPVWIIHGNRDEVIPFWNGEVLFFAAPIKYRAKPFWVEIAGHNNIETLLREDGTFYEEFRGFLLEWVPIYGSYYNLNPSTSHSKGELDLTIRDSRKLKSKTSKRPI